MKRNIIVSAVLTAVVAVGASGCTGLDSSNAAKHPYSKSGNGPQAKDNKTTKPKADKPESNLTTAQQQAIGSAQDYLGYEAFSRLGLIKQLSSKYGEGFKPKDAVFAVNHIKVNWNEEAVKSAKEYLSTEHFSRAGLIGQLTSKYGEQFTQAQAVYAANHVGL